MISQNSLNSFLSALKNMNIMVVGDLILDHYLYGQINRISPEAPVPILQSEHEEYRLGGAGNVFLNLLSLGAKATLVGALGQDDAAQKIHQIAPKNLFVAEVDKRMTPVKTRLIAQRQQILRIDRETTEPIPTAAMQTILSFIDSSTPDAFLLSDYAKGTLSAHLIKAIVNRSLELGVPVIADPKPINIQYFQHVTAITPNRKEAEAILDCQIIDNQSAAKAAMTLCRRLKSQMAVITRGADGVTAHQRRHHPIQLPAFSHEVFDVTGAGDTFAALLTLGLVAKYPLKQTLWLANAASSIVIERIGASSITPTDLKDRCHLLNKK